MHTKQTYLLRSNYQVDSQAIGDLMLFERFIVFQYFTSEY